MIAFAATAFTAHAAPAMSVTPDVPPPALSARAYVLFDATSGQVLAAQAAGERFEPASLTKLMTAYLVFDALKTKKLTLAQTVSVSERAWKAEGSRMFIDPKQTPSVESLIRGMIVQSGNDAAIALAEAVAGSEEVFAQLMNKQAQKFGMANSKFLNATGLPNMQHYSTADDLLLLSAALIRDFPLEFAYYKERDFTHNKITQPNRNRLLQLDPTVDGLKTGHTDAAGYCLIATAKRTAGSGAERRASLCHNCDPACGGGETFQINGLELNRHGMRHEEPLLGRAMICQRLNRRSGIDQIAVLPGVDFR